MFSNRIFRFSLRMSLSTVVSVMLLMTGCDRFLKSKSSDADREKQQTFKIDPQEFNCLTAWPEKARSYFDDSLPESEIPGLVSCLQDSLKTFTSYTRGNNPDMYTAEELQHFLNRYLLKENQIGTTLMNELMKLKVVFVGGNRTDLSRSEVTRITQVLDVVKDQAVKLNGRWKTIFFRDDKKAYEKAEKREEFNRTETLTREAMKTLLKNSQVHMSHYTWDDIKSLHKEIGDFLGTNKVTPIIDKWLPVADAVKKACLGEQLPLPTAKDWENQVLWSLQAYFEALRFYYHVKPRDFNVAADWQSLSGFIDHIFALISSSPQMKKNTFIPIENLDQLLDAFIDAKLIKLDVPTPLLKSTYRKVLTHFLDRQTSGNGGDELSLRGLEARHLAILKFEFNVWKISQAWIIEEFSKRSSGETVPYEQMQSGIDYFAVEKEMSRLSDFSLQSDAYKTTWKEWLQLIKQNPPMALDNDVILSMSKNPADRRTGIIGMSILNTLRSLVRLVQRGYGDINARNAWSGGVTQRRLVDFEQDFREFANRMGFLDPRSNNSGVRTFLEANLFSWHGNGDDKIDSVELIEEIMMMVAGGNQVPTRLWKLLKNQNDLIKEVDWINRPLAKREAVQATFRQNIRELLSGLPQMADYIANLGPQQYEVFFNQLLSVSRVPGTLDGSVEKVEARNMSVLLHYLEALFTVYDTNQDGLFSAEEIAKAEPRFRNFIASVSPLGNRLVTDVLIYLVTMGEKPSADKITGIFSYGWKKWRGELPKADRGQMLKVMAVLKQENANKMAASQSATVAPPKK